MKISIKTILKILLISFLTLYITVWPSTELLNDIEAIIVLILSFIVLYKARNNSSLFIMFIFIFYVNYSIVMGEYLFFDTLSVPMSQVKSIEIYGVTLRTLFLFMAVITLFYNGKYMDNSKIRFRLKSNWVIFYVIITVLFVILLYGIDRTAMSSYSVRISPIYEYSKLLFLFAYYYSGDKKHRKFIMLSMMGLFVLSDFYYGGRITSLQILMLLAITIFSQQISAKKMTVLAAVGIFLNGLVGTYRNTYNIMNINIIEMLNGMVSTKFVFNTATFAYYASATHVAAKRITSTSVRFDSLIAFVKSVFSGGNELSDVSTLVRTNYFNNYGGGLITTHFYFWFGWFGVLLIAFILVTFINNVNPGKNDLSKLLYLAFVINSPRWYLYSPNQLFRGVLFFVPVIYVLFYIINELTNKRRISKQTSNEVS